MSKKSYMNLENILGESIFSDIAKALTPDKWKEAGKERYLRKKAPEIKKLTKGLEKSIEKSNKLSSDLESIIEKEYGVNVKMSRRSIEDFIDIG